MPTLSEELRFSVDPGPPDPKGLLVKVPKFTAENYSREAMGIVPIFVTGHEAMSDAAWRSWVRRTGAQSYGPAYTERVLDSGIDLRDMGPTAGFGREMRRNYQDRFPGAESGRRWNWLSNVIAGIESMVQWPSVATKLATEFVEVPAGEMTLAEFVDRLVAIEAPVEIGGRRNMTLGDLLFKGPMTLARW